MDGVNTPLQAFDAELFNKSYTDISHVAPEQKDNFKDAYLYPMLASNEEKRLQMLWQHTHGLRTDNHLMKFLQDTVSLANDYFNPDCVIIGILDRDFYSRVSVAGCPIIDIPRREATCSHTILQPESSGVFMLPNMADDWRFANSPHVVAGLRFYAGVPLRYKIEDTEVVFGTMCIARFTPFRLLTEIEQKVLMYMGNSVVQQIVSGAQRRLRQSEEKLLTCVIPTLSDLDRVLEDIKQIVSCAIPEVNVSIHKHTPTIELRSSASTTLRMSNILSLFSSFGSIPAIENNTIQLKHGKWIHLNSFVESVWCDYDVVTGKEYYLGTTTPALFGKPMTFPNRTVRALSVPVHVDGVLTYTLLIETEDLKKVFSHAEISFATAISTKITTTLQHYLIGKANSAKAHFLSSMSHEMRTPLHGILSASRLLQEETKDHTVLSLVHTIESSSKNLLGIVNNLIEFDKLESQQIFVQKDGPHSLQRIEQDVLDALTIRDGVTLLCDNCLPIEIDLALTDQDLLKQCLLSILQNAVQATERGHIFIQTMYDFNTQSIIYDIKDTGKGIPETLYDRIFVPFTKVDPFSAGSGLGLNISRRIAYALGGDLSLVSSKVGEGSHFRLKISHTDPFHPSEQLDLSGLSYYSPLKERQRSKGLQNFLQGFSRIGIPHKVDPGEATIIVLEDAPSLDYFDINTILTKPYQVLLLLCEASGKCSDAATDLINSQVSGRIVICRNPAGRIRLLESLKRVKNIHSELSKLPRANNKYMNDSGEPEKKKAALDFSPPLSISDPAVAISPRANITLAAIDTRPLKKFLHKNLRALIVDDNVANRAVLVMYCKRRKIAYDIATNGEEALDVFRNSFTTKPFTLVLMDLQMPVCDGITATKNIREFELATPTDPTSLILVVTGLSGDQDKVASKEAGADGFYTKPVSIETLDNIIKYHYIL